MMKALFTFVLAVLLSGCGEPVPVQIGSIREAAVGDPVELVDDAFEILGLPWAESDRSRGTLHLTVVEFGDENWGGTTSLIQPRCYKSATAGASARTIAHEAAHLLGLGHCSADECGPDNLMSDMHTDGAELTDEQFDQLEKGRRRLTACR